MESKDFFNLFDNEGYRIWLPNWNPAPNDWNPYKTFFDEPKPLQVQNLIRLLASIAPLDRIISLAIFGSSIKAPTFSDVEEKYFFGLFKRTKKIRSPWANDIDIMVIVDDASYIKNAKFGMIHEVRCDDGYGSWTESRNKRDAFDIFVATKEVFNERLADEDNTVSRSVLKDGVVLFGDFNFANNYANGLPYRGHRLPMREFVQSSVGQFVIP